VFLATPVSRTVVRMLDPSQICLITAIRWSFVSEFILTNMLENRLLVKHKSQFNLDQKESRRGAVPVVHATLKDH
jgi:hypothetical protein